MKRFTTTQSVDLRLVPVRGLYALRRWGKIVYIGQSNNILRRIGEHAAEGVKEFDSFSYIRCDDKRERDRLEAHWINYFKPKYNINLNYGCNAYPYI